MNRHLAIVALIAIAPLGAAPAQSPVRPPPWWAVADEVTVSLYWNFDTPFPPGTFPPPDFVVAPPWYNPANTFGTASANLAWIPTLNGNIGVLGLVGNGQASLKLKVDNDPHLDWIKIFWFQFDAFEGNSGVLASSIEQNLAKYGRATVTETSEPAGNGWQRVTISAQLIPQPLDEAIDWTFIEGAFGSVAIDNLYVNSKCVKPQPDRDGLALGVVVAPPLNLTLATGGRSCQAVAVSQGPAPAIGPRYWVSALPLLPSAPLEVFQLNNQGVIVGATVNLPTNALQVPLGASDLTVETIRLSGTAVQQFVYALVDRRAVPGGNVELLAIDANANGALVPARNVTLTGFPLLASQRFGLAFDPSGELGAGSFWVSAPLNAAMYEFSRTGQLLDQRALPPGTVGLGYDDDLGNFYAFSRAPRATPSGPVQVNGYELSGYDFALTGVEFCGDLTLGAAGAPRGGLAAGLEVYRTQGGLTSELRLACVAEVGSAQFLYELGGPYRFGWSLLGRCGMGGGPPFVGGSFLVRLDGVPNSVLGTMYLGFSNTVFGGLPLPLPLGSLLGLDEAFLSVSPDANSPFVMPSTPGSLAVPIAIPPQPLLGYTPLFFQWVVLDAAVPGFLAVSQAGKTVIYP